MDGNQESKRRHGGKRAGAGRTSLEAKVLRDTKFFSARGITPLQAHEILSHVIDERKTWHRVLNSDDDRVVLSALTFLTSMRDGKPTQQINVNSQSITLHARDIESARAIIREIRGSAPTLQAAKPSLGEGEGSPLQVDVPRHTALTQSNSDTEQSSSEMINSEQLNSELQRRKGEHMLFGDDGGK